MTPLGLLLGSEPLAEAWRRAGENPLVARWHPWRRRWWVRIAILALLAAPIALLAYSAWLAWMTGANLELYSRNPTTWYVSSARCWLAILAHVTLVLPAIFVLLGGSPPDAEQLEEWSLTRLTRDDVTVALIHWPLKVAGISSVLCLIAGLTRLGSELAIQWHDARPHPQGANVLWVFLRLYYGEAAFLAWVLAAGSILCAGLAPRLRRFHPALMALWPGLLLAFVQHAEWGRQWIHACYGLLARIPIMESGGPSHMSRTFLVQVAATVLAMALGLLVLARASFGHLTHRIWRLVEDDPRLSDHPYVRERAVLGSPDDRRHVVQRSAEVAGDQPGLDRAAGLAALSWWLCLLSIAAAILRPAYRVGRDSLLHDATILASGVLALFLLSRTLLVFTVPVAAVAWTTILLRRDRTAASFRAGASPLALAACTVARFRWPIAAASLLLAAQVLLPALGARTWFRLLDIVGRGVGYFAFGLLLSAVCLATCVAWRNSRWVRPLWIAVPSVLMLAEAWAMKLVATRQIHIAPLWLDGLLVAGPFLIIFLFLDLLPRAANRLWTSQQPFCAGAPVGTTTP